MFALFYWNLTFSQTGCQFRCEVLLCTGFRMCEYIQFINKLDLVNMKVNNETSEFVSMPHSGKCWLQTTKLASSNNSWPFQSCTPNIGSTSTFKFAGYDESYTVIFSKSIWTHGLVVKENCCESWLGDMVSIPTGYYAAPESLCAASQSVEWHARFYITALAIIFLSPISSAGDLAPTGF